MTVDIIQTLQDSFRFGEWNARRGVEQDCRCAYCGRDLLASYNDYNSWQFDHVYPLSLGGEHSFENIVVSCRACNYLKLNYVPDGSTREERISDARRYVAARRADNEAEIDQVRAPVRGTPKA